jgi:integrase
MSLTKNIIDTATYGGKNNSRFVKWDDDPRGLGLRVYPSGRKAFVVSYRDSSGSKRLASIGDYGVFTLDQAQKRARKMIQDAESGVDALAIRKQKREAPTFGLLCQAYIERHAPGKRSGKEDLRMIAKELQIWRTRKLESIVREDVRSLVVKIGIRAPYVANRVLSLLSKMFALAQLWDFLPAGALNPAKSVARFKEEIRRRYVTEAEMPKLAQAIDAESGQARVVLWLYLLTGCRKQELLRARWQDVDAARAVLRLPDTKNGDPHEVPLSPPAIALLEAVPRQINSPYLFPGRVAGKPLESIQGPWDRVREAAGLINVPGLQDVRLHDLRRTVGSWMVQDNNSLHLIGKVLNHKNTKTTAGYAYFAQDTTRKALDAHATKLLGVAGKLPSADVVDIGSKRKVKG